ncbi:MAG: hypothetical protein ABJH07_01070 [Sedimentitalea sp.]
MRIPPFAVIVILCGAVIAATQLAAERSAPTDEATPTSLISPN